MILVNELAEPGIPRPPLPAGRWGGGHMTETLQLGQCPGSTGRYVGMRPFRQTPGRPDEMGHARLPGLDPPLIYAIAITDQEPCPVVDEGGKGFFGATWMDHIESHPLTGHHPEPLQRVATIPGRFINIVDQCLPRLLSNDRIVRGDGLGHPIQDFLDGPQTDGDLQHGGTKGLHDTSAVAVCPGQLAHEGTEPGAVACGMLGRYLGFGPAATVHTPALVQYPVRHLHRDRRQLDHLMRVVRRGQGKRRVATRTPLGPQLLDRCGR